MTAQVTTRILAAGLFSYLPHDVLRTQVHNIQQSTKQTRLKGIELGRDCRAYVLVTLVSSNDLEPQQKISQAKRRQDTLLAALADEFVVDYRFPQEPHMIGYVTASGLKTLAKDENVLSVELSKIDPAVIPALNASSDGRLFVLVSLGDAWEDGRPLNEQEELIKEYQTKVIDRLPGFEVSHRFEYLETFMGYLRQDDISRLATDPDVTSVYMNRWHRNNTE